MNSSASTEIPRSRPALEAFFRLVPAFDSLRRYSPRAFASDTIAGLTVAAVAVPQAMAYALIMGVPPEYGLYTAIVMTAVGAIFDSSKQLINGPTNAISIAMFSALAAIPADEKVSAAILMALLIGLVQTGITLLRLGDLTRYISHAVIVGFTLGAGSLIVLDQVKNLFGLEAPADHHGHFLQRLWLTISEGGPVHLWTTLVGVGTIAVVLLLKLANSRLRRIRLPEFLLAVIGAAALVALLGLDRPEIGVKVLEHPIPSHLPSFQLPDWDLVRISELTDSALAIALLGLLEAIAMAKAIAARTGQKLDINQQCLSEGLANLTGSFFQCFPGSGSLTRSTINHQAGAVTQWSGVISAAAIALTIVLFAPYAQYIPKAALAGILFLSAWRMIDFKQLGYHLKTTRFDRSIVVVTALSAVVVNIEFCILIGIFMSFVFYVPRAARVHMSQLTLTPERVIRERVPGDPACNRMLIYSLEGELFFGSGPELAEHFDAIDQAARDGVQVVVLRLKRVRNPDAVCLKLIEEFVIKLQAKGVRVLLCGIREDMAKGLRRAGLDKHLSPRALFREKVAAWSSTQEAVSYAYELLGEDVCAICPKRSGKPPEKEGWYYMI